MPDTTIIIPTYNEAENIPILAERIKHYVDGACDVLVMDDSPNFATYMACQKVDWQVINRHNKLDCVKGLAPSVIDGIKHAKMADVENVIVMDADMQHPPKSVVSILLALDKHDFVVGSRYVDGGGIKEWGLKRRIISKIANWIAMPLARFKVHDMMSGFFGFKLSGLPELDSLDIKGYKIGTELLVRGNWKSIVEIPYTFEPRRAGKSKLSSKQVFEYLRQLASLYFYKCRWLKFGLVGLTGVVVNLLALWLLTESLGLSYLISAVIAVSLAITNNYTWNYLWTFRDIKINKFIGWAKYFIMAWGAELAYIGLLAFMVELLGMWYMLSASIAILITYLGRYVIASDYIWKAKEVTSN